MERIKNINNKKILIGSISIMVIVLILGFTYAYWTRSFSQTGVNRNTYDCFDINFKEKVEGITIENGYPVSDEEGMQSDAYEVTINNTCKTVASYNVVLNKLNTSTLDNSHIKVAVDNDIRLLSETEEVTSTIENAVDARIISTGVLAGNGSKTISVRSWMDINTTIDEGSNRVFENKITIEAIAAKNKDFLATKILLENKLKTDVQFEEPEPVNIVEPIITENVNNVTLGTSYAIGIGYTYNERRGIYTITDGEVQTIDENSIGKYTCRSTTSLQCARMYKIKEVEKNEITNEYKITKVDQYTLKTKEENNKNSGLYAAEDDEGTSYYFRGDIKNNYVSFGKYKTDIYNLKNNSNNYDIYALTTSQEECEAKKLEESNPDNYTCELVHHKDEPMIWRIVRINGDGSIRLILNDIGILYRNMRNFQNGEEGYLYNTDHICTKQRPCFDSNGTSNIIKELIDNWYKENLIELDNKIILSNYCVDTSDEKTPPTNSTTVYYSSYGRAMNYAPTLKCPDTNKRYGGTLKLKVGSISADEIIMAGIIEGIGTLGGINNNQTHRQVTTPNNYLNERKNKWLTMSPKYQHDPHLFNIRVSDTNAYIDYGLAVGRAGFKPVINLKADTKITSGDGTKDNPYIVE